MKETPYERNRREFFTGKECAVCGELDIRSLELDHVDPAEKETHRIWGWSKERRDAELTKCQVLCIDCHKEKTAKQLKESQTKTTHGRSFMYQQGCRCQPCREANTIKNRRYRRNK